MTYTIKGVAGENYKQLTIEEQAQVQAAGDAEVERYKSIWSNPTTQEQGSIQNAAQEAAQRFAESIFTKRSNALQAKNEKMATDMNSFIASNPNAPSLPTNIDPTGRYSIVNGVLTEKSAIQQDAANKAGVARGELIEIVTPSGGIAYVPKGSAGESNIPNLGTHNTSIELNKATPPTDVSLISNNFSNPTLPNLGGGGLGNTTNASATASGMGTYLDTQLQAAKDEAQRKADLEALIAKTQSGQQESSFLAKLLGSKSPDQARSDALAQTGIDPQQYFAEEKMKIEKIGVLKKEYDTTKATMTAEIQAATDRLASTGSISRQQAAIERKYAPTLNRMSAEINAEAAVLEALQGRFNEAQNFVNQAVQDATATTKFNYDMYSTFKTLNEELFEKLDEPYKKAYDSKLRMLEDDYNREKNEKTQVGTLMVNNPQAGIKITDTLDEAYAKIGLKPKMETQIIGSAETGYYSVVLDANGKVIRKTLITGGSGGGSGGNLSPYINVMQAAIDSGASPEEAAQAAAAVSSSQGVNVNQSTLSQWVSQARNLKPTPATIPSTNTGSTQSGPKLQFDPKTNTIGSTAPVNPIKSVSGLDLSNLKIGGSKPKSNTVLQDTFFSSLFLR